MCSWRVWACRCWRGGGGGREEGGGCNGRKMLAEGMQRMLTGTTKSRVEREEGQSAKGMKVAQKQTK